MCSGDQVHGSMAAWVDSQIACGFQDLAWGRSRYLRSTSRTTRAAPARVWGRVQVIRCIEALAAPWCDGLRAEMLAVAQGQVLARELAGRTRMHCGPPFTFCASA